MDSSSLASSCMPVGTSATPPDELVAAAVDAILNENTQELSPAGHQITV